MSDVNIGTTGLYKTFNRVLIVIVIALLVSVFALAWISQQDPPTTRSGVKVVEDTSVTVPELITEGEPFVYHSAGNKLLSAPADIRMQMICRTDGVESIVTVATFGSDQPVGRYDVDRTSAVTENPKNISSKDCRFQFIATFTVYQTTRDGELRPIPITSITQSNQFEFVVKPKQN